MNKVSTIAATAFVAFATCPLTLLAQSGADNGGKSGAFSRPEDRGEDFTKLSTKELVHRLAAAKDIGEQRKGAKVLGDRCELRARCCCSSSVCSRLCDSAKLSGTMIRRK